jgi:hypothetical protein
MPTRSDIEAATPKCLRGVVANLSGDVCGRPMHYVTLEDSSEGVWFCSDHGPMCSGEEAATRAGYARWAAQNEAAA